MDPNHVSAGMRAAFLVVVVVVAGMVFVRLFGPSPDQSSVATDSATEAVEEQATQAERASAPDVPPATPAPADLSQEFDLGSASRSNQRMATTGPGLVDLQVDGVDLEVFPAFDESILRYAIRLGPDTEAITIRPISSDGDVVSFNGLDRPDGLGMRASRLDPDQITVKTFTVSNELGTRQYEVVVVPNDYPVDIRNTASPFEADWALFVTPTQADDDAFVVKADMNGVPYFWLSLRPDEPFASPGRGRMLNDFKRLPNGFYSYAEQTRRTNEFGRRTSEIVILDERYNEVTRLSAESNGLNHTGLHDFKVLSNGNHLFVAYNGIERAGEVHEDSVVIVVNPNTGDEVFRWNSWNEFDLDADGLRDRLPDYAHINSAFEDDNGDLYLSLRWTSSVTKIDGATGETIWHFGGLRSDFDIQDPWGGPCGQHTAQINSHGNLILFDNGLPCPDSPVYDGRPAEPQMRYIEYIIDDVSMTASIAREIVNTNDVAGPTGSVQELPNDHVLISWAFPNADYSAYAIEEYGPTNELVRSINLSGAGEVNTSYRAYMFAEPDYPTALSDNGASHTIGSGLMFGSIVDSDLEGSAVGDAPDNDGIRFVGELVRDDFASVDIEASAAGYVNAWIDFNGDGDWDDAGEQIFTDHQVEAGRSTLPVEVPRQATNGLTFARFRISSVPGLTPIGHAPDGEVEDYQVQIFRPAE